MCQAFAGELFSPYKSLGVFDNLAGKLTTADLKVGEDLLKLLCVGATDKWRSGAFMACHVLYLSEVKRHLDEDENYEAVYDDFEMIPGKFFRLGDELRDRPRLRLGKKKSSHRWGFLVLLLKLRMILAIANGSVQCWEQLVWRPILGYSQNVFRKWYNHLGSSMTLLAKTIYWRGDGGTSVQEVQHRVVFHNMRFGIDFDQE